MAAFRCAGRALSLPSMAGTLRRAAAKSQLLQQYCSASPRAFHSVHRPAATVAPVSTMGSTGSPRWIASSEHFYEKKEDDEKRKKKRNELVSALMNEPAYGIYHKAVAINDLLSLLKSTGNDGDQELLSEEKLWDLLAEKKEELLVELFKEDGLSKEKGAEVAAVARRLKDILDRQNELTDRRGLKDRANGHCVWLTALTAAVLYSIFK